MSESLLQPLPADQGERELALDPARSVLVQAPAGSGKTDLLTRRFLRLLALVDEPGQIVAITFTIAAAAEMRNRILSELEKASLAPSDADDDFSLRSLARSALAHSNTRGWKLLDLPAQLRISTIDSFCRDLALQQPLLSGLGGGLAIREQPDDLYRLAARYVLNQIEDGGSALAAAVEELLRWRDNNWQEIEDLLVKMLRTRDRWMHSFVVSDQPDWEDLRKRLERPFAVAVQAQLAIVSSLLDQVPDAREEAHLLARFACMQPCGEKHRNLAEMPSFPTGPFQSTEGLEEAREAFSCFCTLMQTKEGAFRKSVDKNHGFPADRKAEKATLVNLARRLEAVPGLETALAAVGKLPPVRYPEEDWQIVRASFTLLRYAAAQLKVVYAEAAAVDFVEVAQIARSVLQSQDGFPTDAALAEADNIRHLLVDEFQDTSRRQHRLLAGLLGAWSELDPDRSARTCFLVGDPMQSIYFFREADAELFARVKELGLEIPNCEPWHFDFATLSANFRTTKPLVRRLNEVFDLVCSDDDGSGIAFSPAVPAREDPLVPFKTFGLHLQFCARRVRKDQGDSEESASDAEPESDEDPQSDQASEIVELIGNRQPEMDAARAKGGKYRIAVLGRTRSALAPVAAALHEAAIPFRAMELEKLAARPEVLDALSLARGLLNPYDRKAWLGVLRAPWCGLALHDLHVLTSADDAALLARPVPELLVERLDLLSLAGQSAVRRVLASVVPEMAGASVSQEAFFTLSPGTWLEQVWLSLGGAACYDAPACANLELLWKCLDALSKGREDVLGAALPAALDRLTALPDPSVSTDYGVQLMTIHKSKGLEFEVVIVPDLQARTAGGNSELLSWLERGLMPGEPMPSEEEDVEDITEFLVAPLPSKGQDSGKAKEWVDREYKRREWQETRRILYVAATRAREELHLFARPTYKVEQGGELTLVEPSGSLLATAWPALEEEVRARFDEWKLARSAGLGAAKELEPASNVEYLAASGGGDLPGVSSEAKAGRPAIVRRLPDDYSSPSAEPTPGTSTEAADGFKAQTGRFGGKAVSSRLYARHEGGLASRALGTAVHTLFEELARLRAQNDWETARSMLKEIEPRIAGQARSAGIATRQATQIAAKALELAIAASHDRMGQWILSPHADAGSEVRWSGILDGTVRSVQADRIFKAGALPETEGQDCWWIIDYKTHGGESDGDVVSAMVKLRTLFAPQLEAYGRVLRNLHGEGAVLRAGLYYPRVKLFDWWEL